MSATPIVLHSATQQVAERAVAAEYYRPEVDGLRGLAVLAVIGFHAFPDAFPGGFVGVDVFFVISGYLISSIILRQLRRSTFTFAQFYARRIRRIFPALIIVLAACLLFGWFALLPDEFEELGKHIASAATFVSNFTLWQESGYFARAAEFKPLLHLWSLGIEEQFYLMWPMLVLLLWKRRLSIVLATLLLTAASLFLAVGVGHLRPVANFYLPVSRFWELGLGCLLASLAASPELLKHRGWFLRYDALRRRLPSLASCAQAMLPVVGVALILAAIFLFDRETTFPGRAALVPTLGAMCIIMAGGESWFQRRIMASGMLVLIGVISYPLYLWHWPVLSFSAILESGTPELSARIVAVLLSFVLAWLTYRYIEHPVRTRRSTRAAVALAGGLSIFGVVGVGVYAAAGLAYRFDVDVRTIRPEASVNDSCPRYFAERDFNYCKSTGPGRPFTMFLGDSRAQGFYDGVVSLLESRRNSSAAHQPFTLLGRGGCPPLLNVDVRGAENSDECRRVWSRFVQYVESMRPAVVVVIGGGSDLLQAKTDGLQIQARQFRTREEAFKHGLRELIVALQRTSAVIYVRELPAFPTAPSCFLRRLSLPGSQCSPTIARSEMEAQLALYNRVVDEIQSELPELRVVDTMSAVCDATVCSQRLRTGEIIYSDALHLSPAGGRHFARRSGLSGIILDEAVDGSNY